ncbi:hypothetical protein BJ875DRAFT_441193 [Amylocarpus encephaloides]|uniref:Uncharacterized protein n=1 Tax=Amylocarpus encephaloides TaxID=45428 RepID=A0A9P7YK73_9HELO|nr:hypothetical protein BJ875DRAFT_441193 [Amylocarpus encephaloides]
MPQPDCSAGCKETIFAKDQLWKLAPFIRGWKVLFVSYDDSASPTSVTLTSPPLPPAPLPDIPLALISAHLPPPTHRPLPKPCVSRIEARPRSFIRTSSSGTKHAEDRLSEIRLRMPCTCDDDVCVRAWDGYGAADEERRGGEGGREGEILSASYRYSTWDLSFPFHDVPPKTREEKGTRGGGGAHGQGALGDVPVCRKCARKQSKQRRQVIESASWWTAETTSTAGSEPARRRHSRKGSAPPQGCQPPEISRA